jgi:predicted NAD-dependent protein-ADP-ribosyltransferase YbiA (DUF1768 family)
MNENIQAFNPYSWLGNMSRSRIIYYGEEWNSAEALFQAMRFNDENIRQRIRNEKLTIKAKLHASQHRGQLVVEPMTSMDIENLRTVMQLKFEQHPILALKLIATSDKTLIQHCTRCQKPEDLFWGMTFREEQWIGMNMAGKILTEIRNKHLHFMRN